MHYHPFQNDWFEDIPDEEAEEEIEIEAIVIRTMFYSVLNMKHNFVDFNQSNQRTSIL